MTLDFEPVGSWIISLTVLFALITFVLLTYPQRIRQLSVNQQRILMGLRIFTAILLGLAMLRPSLKFTKKDEEKPVVIMLADASRSMQTTDVADKKSRREYLLKLLDDQKSTLQSLSRKVTLLKYDFSEKPELVEEFSDQAPGNFTAMGTTLDDLLKNRQSTRIASIFLLGDGAERSIPGKHVSPTNAGRTLGKESIALYAVPLGSTLRSSDTIDASVNEMLLDPVVFAKKTMSTRAKIHTQGLAGRKLKVQFLFENRSGKKLGESGELVQPPVSLNSKTEMIIEPVTNNELIPVELTYEPPVAGEFKVGVRIVPDKDELITRNNLKETIISVRKGGLKVAYFDVLREEVKFIRQINQSEKIQLDYQMIRLGSDVSRTQSSINPKWFDPGEYDVYIIGDVPAEVFGQPFLQKLSDRVKQGAGLMMLGGYHNYGAGGYASTPLAALLPVTMNSTEVVPASQINFKEQLTGLFHLEATNAGLIHFVMRIDTAEKNANRWKTLPEVTHLNKLKPANNFVQVLATNSNNDPVLIATETGQGRVLASGLSETFLWSLNGDYDVHQRFWRQTVLWLAKKEFDSDQTLWVRINPRNYSPESPVLIEYGARDTKGEAIQDAQFDVIIRKPDGSSTKLNGQSQGQGFLGEFRETQIPGDYWVEVSGTKNGQQLGVSALTRFIIDAVDLEMDNPSANIGDLEEICRLAAETTDSQIVMPEKFSKFLQNYVQKEPWKRDIDKSRRISLWDGWPLLAIFVALLTLEWILRKKYQLT